MRRHRWIFTGALILLPCFASQATAQSGSRKYGELLKRIPDQANVLLLVDVDGLYQSKFGQSEGLREKVKKSATGGLGLAADVAKVVVAANYDLITMEEDWKLGMAELRANVPDLKALAARQGGVVETIRNIPVAWTPRGFYLMTFPPKVIGFVDQADRQALAKWINSTLVKPREFPPSFADRAFYRADAGSQIVLTMNLAEGISPKMVEPWLRSLPKVLKAGYDAELLAERLASAQSASLQVDVAQNITGTLRIEFKEPIEYASPILKELILTVLGDYGAMLPELGSWNLRTDTNKKAVELTGPLGTESVRRILSFCRVPNFETGTSPSSGEPQSKGASAATVPELSKDDSIQASQRYFRSVVDVLNGLKEKDRPTYSSMKLWYNRYAKQIEELPILGIDSVLLDWGSQVSRTLREMATGINYAAKDQTYRLAQSPSGNYAGYGGSSKVYDQAVIKRQSDAVMSVQLDGKWQTLEISIADMRRKMVEKYKVEF